MKSWYPAGEVAALLVFFCPLVVSCAIVIYLYNKFFPKATGPGSLTEA